MSAIACVSRVTFYELFDSFEQCFLAALDADPWLARVCLVETLGGRPGHTRLPRAELELLKHMVDNAAWQARPRRRLATPASGMSAPHD